MAAFERTNLRTFQSCNLVWSLVELKKPNPCGHEYGTKWSNGCVIAPIEPWTELNHHPYFIITLSLILIYFSLTLLIYLQFKFINYFSTRNFVRDYKCRDITGACTDPLTQNIDKLLHPAKGLARHLFPCRAKPWRTQFSWPVLIKTSPK